MRHFTIRLVQHWTNSAGERHDDPRIHIVPISAEGAKAIARWREGAHDDMPVCLKDFNTLSQIQIEGMGQTFGYRFRPLVEQPAGFLAYIASVLDEMNESLNQSPRDDRQKTPAGQ